MQENIAHNEEENKSFKINPELSYILEVIGMDIRTVITISHMFKKFNTKCKIKKDPSKTSRDKSNNV